MVPLTKESGMEFFASSQVGGSLIGHGEANIDLNIDAEDFPATATFQDVTQEQQMNPVTMDVM